MEIDGINIYDMKRPIYGIPAATRERCPRNPSLRYPCRSMNSVYTDPIHQMLDEGSTCIDTGAEYVRNDLTMLAHLVEIHKGSGM